MHRRQYCINAAIEVAVEIGHVVGLFIIWVFWAALNDNKHRS